MCDWEGRGEKRERENFFGAPILQEKCGAKKFGWATVETKWLPFPSSLFKWGLFQVKKKCKREQHFRGNINSKINMSLMWNILI